MKTTMNEKLAQDMFLGDDYDHAALMDSLKNDDATERNAILRHAYIENYRKMQEDVGYKIIATDKQMEFAFNDATRRAEENTKWFGIEDYARLLYNAFCTNLKAYKHIAIVE